MGYTVQEFLSDSLADAGVIRPGQTPTGTVLQVARRVFYELVRNWSAVRLRLFFVPETLYPLSASKGSYQIGPGATDFNTDAGLYIKPVFIQAARVIVGNARLWALNILTRPEWDIDQSKQLVDPDGPLDFFYDFGVPIATMNVAPKPAGAQSMLVTQWNPLRAFEIGEEQLNMEDYYPQEYVKAMRKGLCIELAQAYHLTLDQEIAGIFQEALQEIERINNDKLSGSFGASRTLSGPMKGDGSPVAPPGGPGQGPGQ